VFNLALVGTVADLLNGLGAIRKQHQLRCPQLADPAFVLEQRFPLGPGAGVLSLERFQMLTSGNVMLVRLVLELITLGDVYFVLMS
jgi:hypothetical protein